MGNNEDHQTWVGWMAPSEISEPAEPPINMVRDISKETIEYIHKPKTPLEVLIKAKLAGTTSPSSVPMLYSYLFRSNEEAATLALLELENAGYKIVPIERVKIVNTGPTIPDWVHKLIEEDPPGPLQPTKCDQCPGTMSQHTSDCNYVK